MSKTLEYHGYTGSVEFSAEDDCLFGKIEFVDDLIMFDGTSVAEIKRAFHAAVDSYLNLCKSQGKEPNPSFKGSFNVRIDRDLHRRAAIAAKQKGITLNEFVKESISEKLSERLGAAA